MTNYHKILRTYYEGESKQNTAKICKCSRETVYQTLHLAKQKGLIDLKSLLNYDEFSLAELLHPKLFKKEKLPGYGIPDYEKVHSELAKAHVTLRLLWNEYVEDCLQKEQQPYSETQFRRYYHDYASSQNVTIRLKHKPGYAMQVDWAGTKIVLYDEDVCETVEASLFVAVLPFSGLIYAKAFRNEKAIHWINGHIHAFDYFSATPKVLVPDNLKTGVKESHFYSPEINRQYEELADYYGAVVLPTRKSAPKDKAAAENAVKIASRQLIATLRNLQIFNFAELQGHIRQRLESLNSAPLSKRKDCSRWSIYRAEEAPYMQTLPKRSYEYAEWKFGLKVAIDCHISFQKKHYSVPYEYVGKAVDLRATQSTIEVVYHHERICSHKREWGQALYVTNKDHIPPEKMFFLDWNRERFVSWAKRFGPATVSVVNSILDHVVIEEQGYRACLGLMALAKKYTGAELEEASYRACSLSENPSYRMVKHIFQRMKDEDKNVKNQEKTHQSPHGYQRGSNYFGGKKNVE